MKQLIIVLLSTLLFVACGRDAPKRFARIVNADSALVVTNYMNNVIPEVSVANDDTVEVYSYADAPHFKSKVCAKGHVGYIQTKYLERIKDKETVARLQKESENMPAPIEDRPWLVRNIINIVFWCAVIMLVIIIKNFIEPSFTSIMLQLVAFLAILAAGILFVVLGEKGDAINYDIDLGFSSTLDFWGNLLNLCKIVFYMLMLLVGYIVTGHALLGIGSDDDYSSNNHTVGFYLWILPLALLVYGISEKLGTSIPNYAVGAFVVWKIFSSCGDAWPRIHYPIIVALTGVTTCVVFAMSLFSVLLVLIPALIVGGPIIWMLLHPGSVLSDMMENMSEVDLKGEGRLVNFTTSDGRTLTGYENRNGTIESGDNTYRPNSDGTYS